MMGHAVGIVHWVPDRCGGDGCAHLRPGNTWSDEPGSVALTHRCAHPECGDVTHTLT